MDSSIDYTNFISEASPGTKVGAAWLNMIKTEMKTVLDAAGIVENVGDNTQLATAIASLLNVLDLKTEDYFKDNTVREIIGVDGELIDSTTELFIDGLSSKGITSDLREPVFFKSDYLPPVEYIEDIFHDNVGDLKFANRGLHGFFEEYENQIKDDRVVLSNVKITKEDNDWEKITAILNATYSSYINKYTSDTTYTISSGFKKRGTISTNLSQIKIFDGATLSGTLNIDWENKLFTIGQNGVDINSYFLSDDIVFFQLGAPHTPGNDVGMRSDLRNNSADILTGDYEYIKNRMIVELPYPVPYTKTKHLPTKAKWNFDWSKSDNWTIEFNIKPNIIVDQSSIVFDTRYKLDGDDGFIIYYNKASNAWVLWSRSNNISSSINLSTQLINSNFSYIKIIYESSTQIRCYLNTILVGTLATNIPSKNNMHTVQFERVIDNETNMNGYIGEFSIKPSIDETNDHYNSGLPYMDPNKEYFKSGKNHHLNKNLEVIKKEQGSIFKDLFINDLAYNTQLIDTSSQELFLDQSDSLISSNGLIPIADMYNGFHIPTKLLIDNNWIDHPNGGKWGFFEAWRNFRWKNVEDWTLTNATLIKDSDWLKLSVSVAEGYMLNETLATAITSTSIVGCFKKGVGDQFNIGFSADPLVTAKYIWSTDTFSAGTYCDALGAIRVDDIVFITTKYSQAGENKVLIQLPSIDDTLYIKDLKAIQDIDYLIPHTSEENNVDASRSYYFDKWDQPMSFKIKPQFNLLKEAAFFLSDYITDAINDFNFLFIGNGSNVFKLSVNGTDFFIGYDGTNWNGGTSTIGDATAFDATTLSFLQEEHDITLFVDEIDDVINLWIDDDQVMTDVAVDLAAWEPSNNLSIGGIPFHITPESSYADSYIWNFVSHPTSQKLPISQIDLFYSPDKKYGEDESFSLDKFGNLGLRDLFTKNGSVIKEGETANGKWIRFASGLLYQYGSKSGIATTTVENAYGSTSGTSYYTTETQTFPIPFKTNPTVFPSVNTNIPGCTVEAHAILPNQFNLNLLAGAVDTTVGYDWFAIGY